MKLLPATATGAAFCGAWALNSVNNVDALTLLAGLPSASVDLIAVDWPYNGVKDDAWDNQWETDGDFLKWMGEHLAEMKRVLKPNGSYYGFASPRMAARVEVLTGEYFNVINRITWRKPPFSTKAEMFDKDIMRGYFPASEAILFAEQNASDGSYSSLEYELNGKVFKPLKDWFRNRTQAENITANQFNAALGFATTGSGMAGSIFGTKDEFIMPNASTYQKMQAAFPNAFNSPYPNLRREYEDLRREYEDLRREYEDLRREYEDLRRPFTVSADVPYTDVWDFATVGTYAGKHPCEKPIDMMRHIVSASSRPNDLVLDCFCGSGNTLLAAKQLGRNYIGGDIHWAQVARNRLVTEFGARRLLASSPVDDLPLFAQATA
jgi:adenine-specific DNA-methyltransferase